MASVSVRLNLRGLNALMRSAPVQALVDERAKRIAAAAGPDFEVVSSPHKYTARAFVQPANGTGARQEARDKVLTRSLDAAR